MSRSSHLLARPGDPRWVGATQTLGEVGSTQKEMPPSCMNALAPQALAPLEDEGRGSSRLQESRAEGIRSNEPIVALTGKTR
jgi:hypothetical protein